MPIHLVGDSNTLAYRYQTIDVPELFARPIVTTAQFIHRFCANNSFENGELNPALGAFLRDRILLAPVAHRKKRRAGENDRVAEQVNELYYPEASDEFNYPGDPVLIVVGGALDVAWILSQIGPNTDFHLEDPRFDAASFPDEPSTLIPADAVRSMIEQRLAPMGHAIDALVDLGFERIYLRNVHPPTLDDADYYRIRRVLTSSVQRYKVTIVVNRILARLASERGISFLDTWDETTTGGRVDPQYIFDADHLNRAAAELAIKKLLIDLVMRRGSPAHASDRLDI